MKNTLKIARAELLNLFYSPVAWLVILVYFIVCGIGFTEPMALYYRVQKVLTEGDPNWRGFDGTGLTAELTRPVLQQLVTHLYLFIPLLTMGVINREVNAGTIKLLYSSPIRTREIVLGKYLGLLALVVTLIFITCIFLLSATLIITNPETNRHFAALLGVFLVANAYISIGIFISAITNYQIVAGVLTFVVFFILNSISSLWQQYDLFRDITWFLSIAGRANYLLNGLISTRDIFYFLLITVLFVGFAMIRLKSTQESKPWTVSFSRYLGLFMMVLVLGYFSGRPGQVKYRDLTRSQLNTITTNAQSVLKELDGTPLTVTLYTNLLGGNAASGLPQNRNYYLWQFWEPYRRFYPNMQFRYVYYYDYYDADSVLFKMHPKKNIHQIAEKVAKELGIRKSIFLGPSAIRKQIDLHEEGSLLVMQLEYKGKKAWLRTFKDNRVWPDQDCVAGAMSRLSRDSVPKFLFTSGHYERSPYKANERDYGGLVLNTSTRTSLINLGVDADTINLNTADIPSATAALVVADPRADMQAAEQEKIKAWLQQGGNALILAEVKKQPIVNPVLQKIGVHIDNGTIVHPNAHEMPHILKAQLTPAGTSLAQEEVMYLYKRGIVKSIESVIEGGANISYSADSGFQVQPLIELKGNDRTWIENGVLVVDSAAPVFSAPEGDIQQDKYTLGVALTRGKQRIIVTGDADMLTTLRSSATGNAFYSWLLYNKYPFYANYPGPTDKYFTAKPVSIKLLRAGYTYVVPALLLLFAIVLLIRRKRK
jgi:ABC-2 type transport system permease protein